MAAAGSHTAAILDGKDNRPRIKKISICIQAGKAIEEIDQGLLVGQWTVAKQNSHKIGASRVPISPNDRRQGIGQYRRRQHKCRVKTAGLKIHIGEGPSGQKASTAPMARPKRIWVAAVVGI